MPSGTYERIGPVVSGRRRPLFFSLAAVLMHQIFDLLYRESVLPRQVGLVLADELWPFRRSQMARHGGDEGLVVADVCPSAVAEPP